MNAALPFVGGLWLDVKKLDWVATTICLRIASNDCCASRDVRQFAIAQGYG